MATVISVENISKCYRLGMIGGATLKEDIGRWWAKMRSQPDPLLKVGEAHHGRIGDQFWALNQVSFQVEAGEVLGIVGRNGAGKSTLLKILSQVTAPSSGEIKIKGRIASLLEVGTGFHPELTGRDNIYLNGAILGMSKSEIRQKFDEIVAFSGVEEFIDTPVKRYSSGMYVRLAFAVAAHLEPEILIVDEVLAVGDVEFQQKCIGKMQDVSRGGRTVLFVSHTMQAVATLCSRAILMADGNIREIGKPDHVISLYLGSAGKAIFTARQDLGASKNKILKAWIELLDSNGLATRVDTVQSEATIELVVRVSVTTRKLPYLIASFWDELQRPLWEISSPETLIPSGNSEVRIRTRLPKLASTIVSVHLAIGTGHSFDDHAPEAFSFTVRSQAAHKGGTARFPLVPEYSAEVRPLELADTSQS